MITFLMAFGSKSSIFKFAAPECRAAQRLSSQCSLQ